MAYDKDKVFEQLVSNIEADENITSFLDASQSVAPSRETLVEWGLHKSDTIKSLIDNNKVKIKQSLRNQWKKEKASPTLQLALYKLLSTDEERRALSMEYREHGGELNLPTLKVEYVTPDEAE